MAYDHFPIYVIKKKNEPDSQSEPVSLRVMKHWLVGPAGCQMVLMRSRSGVCPHMELLGFSLFNGFRLHLWL